MSLTITAAVWILSGFGGILTAKGVTALLRVLWQWSTFHAIGFSTIAVTGWALPAWLNLNGYKTATIIWGITLTFGLFIVKRTPKSTALARR